VTFDDVTDGVANTLLVVEVCNSGIHWMEPRDLDATAMPRQINAKSGRGISSRHPGLAVVAFVDGRVRTLPDSTPPETVEAMTTIAGSEVVPPRNN
jgi:prepilin-type processing-associated H-X9-DG protein